MKILQGNLHRSKTADDLLNQIILELQADLIIVSEQYRNKEDPGWYADSGGTSAIWIPNISKTPVDTFGAGASFVWVLSTQVTYVSCYFTPSDSIQEFQDKLDELEDFLLERHGQYIVAGDFNSKAQEWGMPTTDSRGRRILEMAARLNLEVMNSGTTPTFRRPGCTGTIPDITLASMRLVQKVSEWKVREEYNGSDHQYITFKVHKEKTNPAASRQLPRWNVAKLNQRVLASVVEAGKSEILDSVDSAPAVVEKAMKLINQACDASMPKTRAQQGNRRSVYWWTEEIKVLRRECLRRRRRLTRTRRTGQTEAPLDEYKAAKKNLKAAIRRSKHQKWEELRQDANNDPWGLGYKIVMRKLGARSPSPGMDAARMADIVNQLFPTHPERPTDMYRTILEEHSLFTEEELSIAEKSLQRRKAPGPDGVPAEAIQVVARSNPDLLLKMFNSCLKEGVFPKMWKVQRLVLISKGKGDPSTPSAYRPLCMLDTAGKLLEKLLKSRLETAISNAGSLSNKQHGFRRGRSTIGAVEQVVKSVHAAQEGNHFSRKIVLLATLDVRNAFNSARWCDILEALENYFKIPEYLLRMVRSYLSERQLLYDTTDGSAKKKVTSGAAQGSILGPDLWNISYDGILRMGMPDNTHLVGYADDIAAVITARNVEEAQRKLNQVMLRTSSWLRAHGLSLATEKTEIVLLTRKRIPTITDFQVGVDVISSKPAVKYLGVHLDTKLSYWVHIKQAVEKATKVVGALSRLMANVGGPAASKRKLLMTALHAVLLYGCEVWADALKIEKYRKQMAAVQRRAALRVACSYRTVSEPAILVVAAIAPIDLMAQERKRSYEIKKYALPEQARMVAREETMAAWTERWQRETKGRWSRRLIPDLRAWVDREHGEVNYYLTQFLTGHGYFNKYLYQMGKKRRAACQYGDAENDDAEHTFFQCTRWQQERQKIEREIGETITPENIIALMLNKQNSWELCSSTIEGILRKKKEEEETEA